jgi:enterochelin esterase family protein
MSLAIRALAELPQPTAADVDAFLAAHTFPLVEGSTATFVFRGEAESVHLQHWIFGLASAQPFVRLPGTDLWYFIQELPERSRVEYKLEVLRNGKAGTADRGKLILDPLNPQVAHDPFGANSVCTGAQYEIPDWSMPDAEARRGTLEQLHIPSATLDAEQPVTIYLPARFRRNRQYPLLIVHDGQDYLRYAALQTVLDNLIHRLEIAPMVVALTDSRDRLTEYAHHPPHARFLAEELVPALEERFPLGRQPALRGLAGASFGAVASLSTGWHYPGRFGRLLLQSGSFAFSDIGAGRRGPVFDPIVKFINAYRDNPKKLADRVFVSCGVYESLIYENRSFAPILERTGMEVRYVEAQDGHNWENWRDRLREGLSWLFPGPLWMVYE